MFSIFKKKEEKKSQKTLVAFASGPVIPIEEVPDPVFAEKTLGGGVAIEPEENVITSPCDGTVTVVMEDSKHAVGIVSTDGMELLLHEGLETVAMQGKGFELFVKVGQNVKKGDKLIGFDPQEIRRSGCETICILTVSNEEVFPGLSYICGTKAVQSDTVIGRY